jgi:excisionase family DNA binding protein
VKPLTPKQCAEKIGVSLSLIYALLQTGKLKGMRIGVRGKGKWLVAPEDLDAFLATCKVSDLPEPDDGDYAYLK